MKRRPSMNLVERAIIAKEWHETVVNSRIHALIGGSSAKLVNQTGKVLYVVLGAAITQGLDADLPAIRIIRGAVNAVHDQAGEPDIPPLRRASIISGLNAAADLIAQMDRRHLVNAACALVLKLRRDDVVLADFEAILN